MFSLANHSQSRADADLKIGGDPAQPEAFGAGLPNCGDLRGVGFLKALAPERPAL